ncbi:MAG: cyclic pyranopterin monophosphate synthase MoaC [Deltaproteobacteria bacterium]|nr:cyclic pyranopterin monophosphate synthase MoaC [Deltaproteobacteria bacterium]
MTEFTHLDEKGHVRMVDVTRKHETIRTAIAQGRITMRPETFDKITAGSIKKGNVLETARIAGIMAAKKTADLIPMCHPLMITHAAIDFFPDPKTHTIRVEGTVRLTGQTGVEMEALTAVSVAALTVYDMCKSHDREMTITDIQLVEKAGGKSGHFVRKESGV